MRFELDTMEADWKTPGGPMAYDLKIRDAVIIDGTGAPRYSGDIGVAGGKVVALGDAPDTASRTVNARGQVAAPGFVDIHTHYDAQLMWDPLLTVSPWHGVTTAVMGNCGFTLAPTRVAHRDLVMRTFERVEGMSYSALEQGLGRDWGFVSYPEYLDAVDRHGTGINVASMIGHTALRLYAMGEEAVERTATDTEIAEIQRLVAEAMTAGAIGFSTSIASVHHGFGGKPVASRLADKKELAAIAQTMGQAGHGIIQMVGDSTPRPWDTYISMAEISRRPVCWGGLHGAQAIPGNHLRELERTRELMASGLRIYPQAACRPTVFEYSLGEPVGGMAGWELLQPIVKTSSSEVKLAFLSDPVVRRRFHEVLDGPGEHDKLLSPDKRQAALFRHGFRLTEISWYPPEPALEGRLAAEIAAERGLHMVDLILDMTLATKLDARFRTPLSNFDDDQLQDVMVDPNVVVGFGDGGAHLSQLCDAVYATFFLKHWVRERRALSLEEGVRRITGNTAAIYGLTDRGRLATGMPADIVIFDPETIGPGRPERVYDLPGGGERIIASANGVAEVFVNGASLPERGEAMPAGQRLPGKLLRGGQATARN